MFFSRVRIEPYSIAKTKLFHILKSDVYAMHQLIWKLFPDSLNVKRDFLFRQEFEKEQLAFSATRRGLPLFYVVSKRPPMPVEGLLSVETKQYTPKITAGMRLGFDVRVNPVLQEKVDRSNIEDWIRSRKKRGLSDKNPTKLRRYHDVMMDAKKKAREKGITDRSTIESQMRKAILTWLSDNGKKSGFQLTDQSSVEVSGYRQEYLKKRGSRSIRFSSVDLSGILVVTEPELFQTLLFSGIGHSRSFGCGMMMVRRI